MSSSDGGLRLRSSIGGQARSRYTPTWRSQATCTHSPSGFLRLGVLMASHSEFAPRQTRAGVKNPASMCPCRGNSDTSSDTYESHGRRRGTQQSTRRLTSRVAAGAAYGPRSTEMGRRRPLRSDAALLPSDAYASPSVESAAAPGFGVVRVRHQFPRDGTFVSVAAGNSAIGE